MSAAAVVQKLLLRYAERPPLPARSPLWIPPESPKGGAVMRFVRTAAGEDLSTCSAAITPHVDSRAVSVHLTLRIQRG